MLRIGLFFSRCGGIIEQVIDLEQLAGEFFDYHCAIVDDFFTSEDMEQILTGIKTHSLDALLLIGESPLVFQTRRLADQLLNEIAALGVNPNKIGFVNLKEQLAMVHRQREAGVFRKAKLLIEAEIAKVTAAEPLKIISIAPRQTVTIIGRTAAGLLAAQQLLKKGFTVYTVDNGGQSGDNFLRDDNMKAVVSYIERHQRHVFCAGADILDVFGFAGDFTMVLEAAGQKVTLNTGAIIVAETEHKELAQAIQRLLHLKIAEDGFFKPLNRDTLRVYSSEEGIFLIQNNSADLGYTAAIADSAVLAVIELLNCPEIKHKIAVSEVNTDLCGGCGTCVKTCLFHACSIDLATNVAVIDTERCKGCGSCVTACPSGARDLLTYPKKYLFKAIEILSSLDTEKHKVLVFLCEGCGYQALDAAAAGGAAYPVGVLPLKIRCGGTIDTQLILQAFHCGFDGVAICKCSEGHCSNIVGNVDLDRRANLFREVLRSRGIDAERMIIVDATQVEGNKCVQAITELYQEIEKDGGGRSE